MTKNLNRYLFMLLAAHLCSANLGVARRLLPLRGREAHEEQESEKAQRATSTAVRESEYLIGAEDVISVNVWKEPDISRAVPVRPDGKISLPLVGEVQARGLTPVQLQTQIATRLQAFVSHPQVTVIVQEVKSRRFNIVGEVQRPGAYDLAKPMTVLDAIALAGGFVEFAKTSKVYILRRGANGSTNRIPFNYKQVVKGRDPEQNVPLQSGDTIIVP